MHTTWVADVFKRMMGILQRKEQGSLGLSNSALPEIDSTKANRWTKVSRTSFSKHAPSRITRASGSTRRVVRSARNVIRGDVMRGHRWYCLRVHCPLQNQVWGDDGNVDQRETNHCLAKLPSPDVHRGISSARAPKRTPWTKLQFARVFTQNQRAKLIT